MMAAEAKKRQLHYLQKVICNKYKNHLGRDHNAAVSELKIVLSSRREERHIKIYF